MKKTKLTRSLLAACSVVALSVALSGCLHSGGGGPTYSELDLMGYDTAGGASVEAGTYSTDDLPPGLVSALEGYTGPTSAGPGESLTIGDYTFTCGADSACSVTVAPDGSHFTVSGTVSVSSYMEPPAPPPPPDTDGDGVPDADDAFPNDPNESVDSDGDGTGDNADAFPNDPAESADSDGDGVGDNADVFPNDPNETVDADGDGIGDNADPHIVADDRDNDGRPDAYDAFPDDPAETDDSDGDGIGDNADPYNVANDRDNDGVSDAHDAFPDDATETRDSDGDGVGDNADAFPDDPKETADADGNGIGDNADAAAAKADANKVANTKKAAITTELNLQTDGTTTPPAERPFDGTAYDDTATAVGANATNNYKVAVKHTGSAVEVEVTDGHADYDAKNDPKFSRAASFGNGQMLVRNDGTDRQIIVLHTDIEAPENVRFGTTGSGYSLTVDVDTDTSAADSYIVLEADASDLGGSAIVPANKGGNQTLAVWADTDAARNNLYRGTLDGAPGTFRCNSGTCTIEKANDDDGTVTITGGGAIWFTPDPGATVSVPDADYMTYGFWLDTTTKGGDITSYDEVQTFATSNLTESTGLSSVTGTATYEGDAAGVYVHETKKDDGTLDTATSGRFTADVSLKAYFTGDPLRTDGTLEGTISDFDLDGGPANNWNVNLSATGIATDAGFTGNASGMTGDNGSLSGRFHGAGDAATDAPPVLVGEFNSTFVNGSVAGAYGARKED